MLNKVAYSIFAVTLSLSKCEFGFDKLNLTDRFIR